MLNRIVATLAGTTVLALAASCADMGVDRTPSPGATPATPEPLAGIPMIDQTIAAVLDKEIGKLLGLIVYHQEGCVVPAQLSTPPECEPGQPVGTPVEVFTIVFCDGGPVAKFDAPRQIASIFNHESVELYAVVTPRIARTYETYRIVFTRLVDGSPLSLSLTDAGVTAVWGDGCGTAPNDEADGAYIIAPVRKR